MIALFSARRSYFRRNREGIRAAFALADRIDSVRLLYQVLPASPAAIRYLERLEQELGGLLARHGGRVAVAIRRRRGLCIPGAGTEVVRLPATLSAPLPPRWWSAEVWLGLDRGAGALQGPRTGEAPARPDPRAEPGSAPTPPAALVGDRENRRPPSVAELSLADSVVGFGLAMGGRAPEGRK